MVKVLGMTKSLISGICNWIFLCDIALLHGKCWNCGNDSNTTRTHCKATGWVYLKSKAIIWKSRADSCIIVHKVLECSSNCVEIASTAGFRAYSCNMFPLFLTMAFAMYVLFCKGSNWRLNSDTLRFRPCRNDIFSLLSASRRWLSLKKGFCQRNIQEHLVVYFLFIHCGHSWKRPSYFMHNFSTGNVKSIALSLKVSVDF